MGNPLNAEPFDEAIAAALNQALEESPLIDSDLYAQAERIRGGDVWGIAEELDLPAWVVEAYRRRLDANAIALV